MAAENNTPNNETVTETAKALAKVDPDFCASCELVGLFTTEAHGFVSWIGGVLQDGMINIFDSFLPLWFLITLFQIQIGAKQISDLGRNFIYIILTYTLLLNNGSEVVSGLFGISLELIGTLGQVTFLKGEIATWAHSDHFISKGIVNLVWTVEKSVVDVFDFALALLSSSPWYAAIITFPVLFVLIILPYLAVTTMFFSQIVIAIFRVILISVFAPVIMFFVAFDWGREMGKTALKTLLASIFIAFASTAAMSLTVFSMSQLIGFIFNDVGTETPKVSEIWPAVFMLASIAWIGIAFMTETTGIANSLAGSMLSNTGAALITGAVSSMAYFAAKPFAKTGMGAGRLLGHGLGATAGAVGGHAANQVGGNAAAHMGSAKSTISRLADIAHGPRKQ